VIDCAGGLYDDTERLPDESAPRDRSAVAGADSDRVPDPCRREGLLMYLTESEVRPAVGAPDRPIRFRRNAFDTLYPAAPWLSKVATQGIVNWGIVGYPKARKWNPRFDCSSERPQWAGYAKIERSWVGGSTASWSRALSNYDVLNRLSTKS